MEHSLKNPSIKVEWSANLVEDFHDIEGVDTVKLFESILIDEYKKLQIKKDNEQR